MKDASQERSTGAGTGSDSASIMVNLDMNDMLDMSFPLTGILPLVRRLTGHSCPMCPTCPGSIRAGFHHYTQTLASKEVRRVAWSSSLGAVGRQSAADCGQTACVLRVTSVVASDSRHVASMLPAHHGRCGHWHPDDGSRPRPSGKQDGVICRERSQRARAPPHHGPHDGGRARPSPWRSPLASPASSR